MQDEITLLEQVHACNQGEKAALLLIPRSSPLHEDF